MLRKVCNYLLENGIQNLSDANFEIYNKFKMNTVQVNMVQQKLTKKNDKDKQQKKKVIQPSTIISEYSRMFIF